MDVFADLIKSVTGFMRYFAPGFIFISCLNYASCVKREEKIEYLVFTCISLSFILSAVADIISVAIPCLSVQIWLIILSVVSGFFVGLLRRAKWVNNISRCLFHREFSKNLFVDLLEDVSNSCASALCIRFALKDDLRIYEGQIYKVLDIHKEPILVFVYYVCYDQNGDIVCDNSNIEGCKLIVNYSDIQSFEFIETKGD